MTLARAERAALSDTLEKTDPERPTLCAGWTARDLLAHLLVRERQPWSAVGAVVPALAPATEQAMRGYAATPWSQMVDELRAGPPAWSPYRIGGVDVRRPSGEQAVIKTGKGLVTVEGEPGEILLHGFGRDAVRVDLRGEPADVAALEASS